MRLEGVDSLGPNRTEMYFRADDCSYWSVHVQTEPHKAYYTVTHDGWVVYELTVREYVDGTEVFACGGPREPIPAAVLSHLPCLTRGDK